jgi:hypothetical protein
MSVHKSWLIQLQIEEKLDDADVRRLQAWVDEEVRTTPNDRADVRRCIDEFRRLVGMRGMSIDQWIAKYKAAYDGAPIILGVWQS